MALRHQFLHQWTRQVWRHLCRLQDIEMFMVVRCRCWAFPRNNKRRILQPVTLRHWSSHQPPQAGTADTCIEFDTSKCSLLVRHSCKAFPRHNKRRVLGFQRFPNSQQNAYTVDLQSSGAAVSNAASAALDDSAPTVLTVVKQALTSDFGHTSITSTGTVDTSTVFCTVRLLGT